jgi:AcrR family transcriptional regulator
VADKPEPGSKETARSHGAGDIGPKYEANSALDANERSQTERYHSGVDRERMILDAAAAAFYEKGFHGVGVDELGKRAGLTGPTLYRYFSSKDEILAALFNEAMDELVSATAMVHDEPMADLARLIRHHVGYAVSQRQLVNVYQREDRSLTDPWRRHFNHRRKQYVARWEAIVARCVPGAAPAEVAALTQSILGLIFSIAYWPPQTAEVTGLAELIVAFTSRGLSGIRA